MKHRSAFPADGREDQKVDCQESIDSACEIVCIRVGASWLYFVSRDNLKRTWQ
jgi:hypothetical protein